MTCRLLGRPVLVLVLGAFIHLSAPEPAGSIAQHSYQHAGNITFVASSLKTWKLNLIKYTAFATAERVPLSYLEALRLFESESKRLLEPFLEILREGQEYLGPYFFETPPATLASVEKRPFEFVLVEAGDLSGMEPDADAFELHFSHCEGGVTSFPNLGKDAVLVAPCPTSFADLEEHAHLADFSRNADVTLQRSFWGRVAEAMLHQLSEHGSSPLWLSTSGLGVAWLHARIDTVPKYYTYPPYKFE